MGLEVLLPWASRETRVSGRASGKWGLSPRASFRVSPKKHSAFYEWEDPLCGATPSIAWGVFVETETIAPQLPKETDLI